MAKFKPQLTQDEFEGLHEVLDGTRRPIIKVDREALQHLLSDHSDLLGMFENELGPDEPDDEDEDEDDDEEE